MKHEGNPAKGIAYGLFLSLLFWLIVWLLCGCTIHKTPVQDEFLMYIQGEPEDRLISSEEIEQLFADRYPKLKVVIEPGVYKEVPRGIIGKLRDAPWCAPGVSAIQEPKGWDCNNYAKDLDEKMGEEYAFGQAWTPVGTKYNPGHVVNVFIGYNDREVILYDQGRCVYPEHEIEHLYIGSTIGTYELAHSNGNEE